MIRINLLGVAKPKKGKRAAAAVPTVGGGEGPNPMIVGIVLLAIALGGNYWYWNRLQHEAKQIAEQREQADAENRRLSAVKAKYDEAEKQKELYRNRVEVIDKLRSNQSGPVDLLNTIGDTVSKTDAVWLNTMKDDGNAIALDGTALSANAVANLISNLKNTGYFKSVEIRETYQDDGTKDLQAFQFSLVCEKADKKS